MKADKVVINDSGEVFREGDIVELLNFKTNVKGRIIETNAKGRIVEIDTYGNKIRLDCSNQYREKVVLAPLSVVGDMKMSNFKSWEDEYDKMANKVAEVIEESNNEIQKLKKEIEALKQKKGINKMINKRLKNNLTVTNK